MSRPGPTVHAGCILLGAAGVLIRGPSGIGKSRLALELLGDAAVRGEFAALVCDDRTHLAAHNGRLVALAPAAISGRIEVRGLDVVTLPHVPKAVVRLVVDLVPEIEMRRLRDENIKFISLLDVDLPFLEASPQSARRLIPVALGTSSITY
jgi:serine kinase of HPr protein (carbohydrate metabolism regulator)